MPAVTDMKIITTVIRNKQTHEAIKLAGHLSHF